MGPSLQSILGADALAAFETTGPVAPGLPGAAYTSEAFFALENERIFSRSWVFVGFVHELARAGDVLPITVAGQPVLLVRDADEEVRAFHNVCRHRCLKLVGAPGNVGRAIRCPYHSWTYGLDGTLHIAPYFGGRSPRATPEGFDRGRHGLAPVRAATWHDWVFVNLNGAAPPLEDFIAPLRRRLGGLDLTRLHHVVTVDFGKSPRIGSCSSRISSSPTTCSSCTRRPPSSRSPTTTRSTIRLPRVRRRRLRRVVAQGHPVARLALSHPFPELRPRGVPAGPDRRTPRRAGGAGPHPSATGNLQSRVRDGTGRVRGTAREALARGAPRGPRHAGATAAGARVRGGVERGRALSGVGGFGAELSGARGQPPAMKPRSRPGATVRTRFGFLPQAKCSRNRDEVQDVREWKLPGLPE